MKLIENNEKIYINGQFIGSVKEILERLLNSRCKCDECVEEAVEINQSIMIASVVGD